MTGTKLVLVHNAPGTSYDEVEDVAQFVRHRPGAMRADLSQHLERLGEVALVRLGAMLEPERFDTYRPDHQLKVLQEVMSRAYGTPVPGGKIYDDPGSQPLDLSRVNNAERMRKLKDRINLPELTSKTSKVE